MAQLQAGAFLDSILHLADHPDFGPQLKPLLRLLSHFECKSPDKLVHPENGGQEDLASMVLDNLLSRGLPTRASAFAEQALERAFGQTRRHDDEHRFGYALARPELEPLLFRALHVVDPRATVKSQIHGQGVSWNDVEAVMEDNFLYAFVPEFLGEAYVQLLQRDRSFPEMLRFHPKTFAHYQDFAQNFLERQVKTTLDFALELPYLQGPTRAFLLEIEAEKMETLSEKEWNDFKDHCLEAWGQSLRLRVAQEAFQSVRQDLRPLVEAARSEPYLARLEENFHHPLWESPDGALALQLALAPLGAARVLKVLLRYLLAGKLDLRAERWKIAVVERDLPCAELAFDELRNWRALLAGILPGVGNLPPIELEVFASEPFLGSPLRSGCVPTLEFAKFPSGRPYDLVLDVSVLAREGLRLPLLVQNGRLFAELRSAHAVASRRRFHFAPQHLAGHDWAQSRYSDLRALLGHLFRYKDFKAGQWQALLPMLNQENLLAELPANFGKTLPWLVNNLLGCAPALLVFPDALGAKTARDKFARLWVDAYQRLDFELEPRAAAETIDRLTDRGALWMLLPGQNLLQSVLRKALLLARQHRFPWANVVFAQAHCLVESSHDHRPSLFKAPATLRRLCATWAEGRPLALHGFSRLLPPELLPALKRELGIDAASEHLRVAAAPTDSLEVLACPTPPAEAAAYELAIRSAAAKKGELLAQLFADKDAPPTVVYVPNDQGFDGISSTQGIGVADKLEATLGKAEVARFHGAARDDRFLLSKPLLAQSKRDLERFQEGMARALVATEGLEPLEGRHAQRVLHFLLPDSLESLVELSEKHLPDGRPIRRALLFNPTPALVTEAFWQADEQGEPTEAVETRQWPLDLEQRFRLLRQRFPGAAKEEAMLEELLAQVTAFSRTNAQRVAMALEAEFARKFNLELLPEGFPFQVALLSKGKRVGLVDYRGGAKIDWSESDWPAAQAQPALARLLALLREGCPRENDTFDWLRAHDRMPAKPGFEPLLEPMQAGQTKTLELPFHNAQFNALAELLAPLGTLRPSPTDLLEAYELSPGPEAFQRALANLHGIELDALSSLVVKEMEGIIPKLRGFKDSLRALARLRTIGLVDDFEIESGSQHFNVFFSKKKDEQYVMALFHFLSAYQPKAEAMKVFERVVHHKGRNSLQKSLFLLTRFSYEEILPKRAKALEQLGQICAQGLLPDGRERLRDIRQSHFLAKYAASHHQPNLWVDTRQGRDQEYEVVEKYVALASPSIENLRHLRESTRILLDKHPENYVFLLLDTFAFFALNGHDPAQSDEGMGRLSVALRQLQQKEPGIDSHVKTQAFIETLTRNSDCFGVKNGLAELLRLSKHRIWLEKFNRRFLDKTAASSTQQEH